MANKAKKKAPKKTSKKKMGRPPIEIDFKIVAGFCNVWATEKEIADYFGCSIQTINEKCKEENGCTFLEYYKKNNTAGKLSLRRAQFKSATEKNNVSMQIWLGKQHLGQRDAPEPGSDEDKVKPVKVIIEVEDGRKSKGK